MRHLQSLESEAIFILRETAALFKKAVILFSGGKDSVVLTHLAEKAFYPFPMPFEFLLIDTGHNFPETLEFISNQMKQINKTLLVGSVEKIMQKKGLVLPPFQSRNALQSVTLMEAIHKYAFDAVIGGARRDEEKARAKERIFSIRGPTGAWEPESQQPELWMVFGASLCKGQHMRVFPLSNWTELDIWEYINQENLTVPSIYFSHARDCILRGDVLMPKFGTQSIESKNLKVRVRTVGDMLCTAVFPSHASTIKEVITELNKSRISERGLRMDDRVSKFSMEERKKEGYF